MNFTEYLKLNLPTPTTVVDIDDLNENSIKIDQELKKLKAELETAGSDEEIQIINKKIEELEKNNEELKKIIDDKADKGDLKVHLEKDVGEDNVVRDFENGLTISAVSSIALFPSINKFGISLTFINKTFGGYGQLVITSDGDIWSRRTNSLSSWGKWYSVAENIDKKADKKDLFRSSTIVIANYDSYESSKASADVVIKEEENAAKKINDAIQSLKNTGGEVKLMEGNYQLDSKISILIDNVTLKGLGRSTKLVARNLPSGSGGALVEVGEGSNEANDQVCGISVVNIEIDGANTKEDYRGLALWGAVNSTISNVVCINNNRNGIQISNNSTAYITNVECSDNIASGVALFNDASAIISNVTCNRNDVNGIALFENSSIIISNARCNNNSNYGILVFDNASATITNVSISENKRDGIRIASSSENILIRGASLKNNHPEPEYINQGQLNLGVHSTEFKASNIFVTGCKILDTKGNTRGVVIRGNNQALTNTQFVGAFKEKINDDGKNTQLIGNVGV